MALEVRLAVADDLAAVDCELQMEAPDARLVALQVGLEVGDGGDGGGAETLDKIDGHRRPSREAGHTVPAFTIVRESSSAGRYGVTAAAPAAHAAPSTQQRARSDRHGARTW